MKQLIVLIAVCLASTLAQAGGLPYAVESLTKAQELVKTDGSKHLLVFYTSEN